MIIYVFTIILSVLFAFFAQSIKNKENMTKKDKISYYLLCILSFLPPFLVAAFRGHTVGTDTGGTYYNMFNQLLYGDLTMRDFGFKFLINLAIWITHNYSGLLFITSLILYACFYKAIFKESKYPTLSVYLFFATNVYFISMNMIRQSIATSLFVLSIPYIKEKSFIKFLIINLIAISMHSTALLYLVTYFLFNKKINKNLSIFLCLFSILFGTILGKILLSLLLKINFFRIYFAWYINSIYNAGELNLFSILITGSILIFLYYINAKGKENTDYNILLWLETIAFMCLAFSPYIPLMQRVSWLFSFPLFIYLPKMLDFIDNSKIKFIMKVGIIGGYTLYMIMTIFVMGYHDVVPYTSIFG